MSWYGPESKTMLGLKANRQMMARRKPFTVSVYKTRTGEIRYTGPVNAARPPRSANVLYRIKVSPKRRTFVYCA